MLLFDGKVFWVNLEDWLNDTGRPEFIVLNSDGTSLPTRFEEDGDMFSILENGRVIGDSSAYPSKL